MIKVLETAKRLINCKSITTRHEGVIEYLSNILKFYGFTCHVLDLMQEDCALSKNHYASYGSNW